MRLLKSIPCVTEEIIHVLDRDSRCILSHELRLLGRRFAAVADIRLDRATFRGIQLHRNNAYYDLLLKVSELAYDCLLPDPNGHGFIFNDVLRDERKMAHVFEQFVRNFFALEQNLFSVGPLTIQWDAIPRVSGDSARLPNMRTDIFLHNQSRQIIIDTKYYIQTLQAYYGNETFHSENLYQMFSYVKNAAGQKLDLTKVEGLLLYPQVGLQLREAFVVQGHIISVATINLAAPWPKISSQLLGLLATDAQ